MEDTMICEYGQGKSVVMELMYWNAKVASAELYNNYCSSNKLLVLDIYLVRYLI